MTTNKIIPFTAIINKIATTTDGGSRITMDISQADADVQAVLDLIKLKFKNVRIAVAIQELDD